MIRASLLALAFVAAACTPPADPPEPATPAETESVADAMPQTAAEATAQDTCGGAQYRPMIGANIAAVTVPEGVRVIAPDTVVTQDFRPDRINILVDAQGVITDVQCY